MESSREIIRAECPNPECNTYLKPKQFGQNLIPYEITECQFCKEKKPIYLTCPTCNLYLCKKCIVYHEKVLHLHPEIPVGTRCNGCQSLYIELQCSICENWYCARCFPKNREYFEYWYKDVYIDNPLKIDENSIKNLLDTICIKCIDFLFNCDNCDTKNDPESCKQCIIKSRIRIYDLAIKKLEKDLKK
ncbi:MAG: hypothetical protein ACTSYZ_09605 [Candidatus Helarchaeota archaeon]